MNPIALASILLLPLAAPGHSAPNAGELRAAVDRLQVTARVLYVAAHPDDENTRLLAWLVGERGVDARYLSMTRGGGGQNLIGTEQAEMLGLVRTLELLAARAIDGAGQWFTRARDFGYSKNPEETLRIWGHERALSDVVRTIRRFQPDVIVTRFAPTGINHGHHTASAILAAEAFEAAADPARFPEHKLPPWRAERLIHNVSTWRLADDADMSAYLAADVGGFSPLLGASWGEVAAWSRTMHKSQGFGSAPQRGPILEYFEPVAGSAPDGDILSGVEMGWARIPGGERVSELLAKAASDLDPTAPHKALPALADAYRAMKALPPSPRRDTKLAELRDVIVEAAGLWLAARADTPVTAPSASLEVSVEALGRSPADMRLLSLGLPGAKVERVDAALTPNAPLSRKVKLVVASSTPLAIPHWLAAPPTDGAYQTRDTSLIGVADTPPALSVRFNVRIAGLDLEVERPVLHAQTDRVRGEILQRVEVEPPVTTTPSQDVLLFPAGRPAELRFVVRAGAGAVKGSASVELPRGWKAEPARVPFDLAAPGDQQEVRIRVTPPARGATGGAARLLARVGRTDYAFRLDTIDYEHIDRRSVLRASDVKLVPLAVEGTDRAIGYIPGSGDKVAEGLEQVGFSVRQLNPEHITAEDLKGLDAVMLGVRAYNVHDTLRHANATLWSWVEAGGVLIVQYNTHSRWSPLTAQLAPFPLELGRDRATDETAPLTPIDPAHKLLTTPNRLTPADYEGWVQERGLYFAASWDPRFKPIFSVADPGETASQGSLLVASHGKGAIAYTGISFFRQLPAGVPGAYRLLANLLAYEP